jgi:hypothetical protein
MGRNDLIGNGAHQLVPLYQPRPAAGRAAPRARRFHTQHTGLPPRPR